MKYFLSFAMLWSTFIHAFRTSSDLDGDSGLSVVRRDIRLNTLSRSSGDIAVRLLRRANTLATIGQNPAEKKRKKTSPYETLLSEPPINEQKEGITQHPQKQSSKNTKLAVLGIQSKAGSSFSLEQVKEENSVILLPRQQMKTTSAGVSTKEDLKQNKLPNTSKGLIKSSTSLAKQRDLKLVGTTGSSSRLRDSSKQGMKINELQTKEKGAQKLDNRKFGSSRNPASNQKIDIGQRLSTKKGVDTTKHPKADGRKPSLPSSQPARSKLQKNAKKLCRRAGSSAAAECEMANLSQQPANQARVSSLGNIPPGAARTSSGRLVPAGIQSMSRYVTADPLPNVAIGLSSVAAGAGNSAAMVGCCCGGKVCGVACSTAAACGLGAIGATFATAAASVAVAAGWRNYQRGQEEKERMQTELETLRADARQANQRSQEAVQQSQRADQQSQEASQQSAAAAKGLKKIASKTDIHGKVLPKIASQVDLDDETQGLLGGVGSSSEPSPGSSKSTG